MGCGASSSKAVAVTADPVPNAGPPAIVSGSPIPGEPAASAQSGKPAEPTAEDEGLTEERLIKVTDSWALVAADLTSHGIIFFKKVFDIAPEALQLFSFRDEDNLYESKALRAHATKVMTTVGIAVAGLADIDKLVPVLKGLGKKHKSFGVLPAHFKIVGQALFYALEQGLGEAWTDDVKAAWSIVYGVVATTMIAGAEYDNETGGS